MRVGSLLNGGCPLFLSLLGGDVRQHVGDGRGNECRVLTVNQQHVAASRIRGGSCVGGILNVTCYSVAVTSVEAPHVEAIPLEGYGVALRPLRSSDVQAIYEISCDPVTLASTGLPNPYQLTHAQDLIDNPRPCMWAIVSPDDGDSLLGTINLRVDSEFASSVGYMSAPWARGRGVMTAAVQLVRDYSFARGFIRFEIRAYSDNVASRRVAEKVGMRFEGILRNAGIQRGEPRDMAVYSSIPADMA